MDRVEFGEFLRRRREALRPQDVGLVDGGRRRTPGLRREEVAVLASMSGDYYERLEQGRGPRPSPAMLGSLARALRLTVDERDYLYMIAGHRPPAPHVALGYADPGLMTILDALAPNVPALITDDLNTVLAQNPLNTALLGPLAGLGDRRSNFTWRWFTDPVVAALYAENDRDATGRSWVADLRAAIARRGTDATSSALVQELRAASDEFDALWSLREVAVRNATRKVLLHPVVGRVECECSVVLSPPSHQRLVLFRAAPGTDSGGRLDMLRVIGTQDITSPPVG